VILEEEIDPNYVPGEDEVLEYAKWLGMDLDKDEDLYWIAREGLMAPLPKNWKPCKTKGTDDIYYFNFETGESTWDHPCDGYYKRLYEEEKKKKEVSLKESADEKRTKAKQDVELLLGKSESSKKSSKKKKGPKGLPATPGVGAATLGVEAKLGGAIGGKLSSMQSSGAPAGLEKKPLPGIMPKLSLSQSEPKNLSALAPIGSGSMHSSSSSALGKKAPLPAPTTVAKTSLQSSSDFKSAPEDSDTDDDTSEQLDAFQARMNPPLDRSDSPIHETKKKKSKSQFSSRLKNVLSDSEDMSTVADSPVPMGKTSGEAKIGQSSDSEGLVRQSDDSFAPSDRKTAALSSRPSSADIDLEGDRKLLQAQKRDLADQQRSLREQMRALEAESKELEAEKRTLSSNRKNFEENKLKYEEEVRKKKEEAETARQDYEQKMKELKEQNLPTKASHSDSSGVDELKDRLAKMKDDMDALRRDNISLTQEIEKGKKTLDSEKSLRSASIREFDESTRSMKAELANEKRISEERSIENAKLQEQCKRYTSRIEELERELLTSRKSVVGSSTDPSTADIIQKLEAEIGAQKQKVLALEDDVAASSESEKRQTLKLKQIMTDLEDAQNELSSVRSELRGKVRELDAKQDDVDRLSRDVESLRKRNSDQEDELIRVRQTAQRAGELQFIVDSERQTHSRLKSEYEALQQEFDRLRLTESSRTEKDATYSMPSMESSQEVESLKSQLADLQRQKKSITLEFSQQKDEIEYSWKQKFEELKKSHQEALECGKNDTSTLQMKYRRLEQQFNEKLLDAEDLEKRLQTSKKRMFETQEQLDAVETELAASKSRAKQESFEKSELESRVGELTRELQEMRHKLRNQSSEVETLESEKLELRKEQRELREKCDGLSASLQQKASEVTRLEAESSSLRGSLKDQIADHQAALERLKKENRRSPDADSLYNDPSQLKELMARNKELESLLSTEKRMTHDLRVELETTEKKLKTTEVTVEAMEQKNSSLKASIDDLENQLDELRRQNQCSVPAGDMSDLEFKLKRMETAHQEVQLELKEEISRGSAKDRKIANLQAEIVSLNERAAEIEVTSVTASSSQSDAQSATIINLKEKIRSLQADLDETEALKAEAMQNMKELQRRFNSMNNDFEEMSFRNTMLTQDLESSNQRVRSLETETSKAHSEKSSLLAKLSTLTNENAELKTALTVGESERDGIQRMVDGLQKDLTRYRDEIRQLHSAKSAAEQRLNDREIELETEKLKMISLSHNKSPVVVHPLGGDAVGSEEANAQYSRQLAEMNIELSRYRQQLRESELNRDDAKAKCVELKQEIQRKDAEIDRLNNELRRARNQLASGEVLKNEPKDSKLNNVIAGHGEQITALQSHQMQVQQTIDQQNTLVQKLEEKLRDTESVIKQHLDDRLGGGDIGRAHRMLSPPSSPQSDGLARRGVRYSDGGPKMKHRYKPAPKTSKSRLHMNDFDVYGEQQQRMLDMTYDSIEMSEEEEDIVSKKYTRNNPQTNAASVLRDVLLDLIDRESKRNNQVQKRKTSSSRRTGHYAEDKESERWRRKIETEKKIIQDVRLALKKENAYVREVSSTLNSQREGWRRRKDALKRSGNGNSKILKDMKAEGARLNMQAEQLNSLVKQIRQTQTWVSERERKLARLESMILNSERLKDFSEDSHVSSSEHDTLALHAERMRKLEDELENDLTTLGADMSPAHGQINSYYSDTDGARSSESNHTSSAGHSKAPHRHGTLRSRDDADRVGDGGVRRSSNDALPWRGHSAHIGRDDYLNRSKDDMVLPSRSKRPLNRDERENMDSNAVNWDTRINSLASEFLGYQLQSETSVRPNPSVEYVRKNSGRPVGVHSSDYAHRIEASGAAVGIATGNANRTGDLVTGRGAGRDQIKHLTEMRVKSSEACDDHVSWLDNLRREIGQFAHTQDHETSAAPGPIYDSSSARLVDSKDGVTATGSYINSGTNVYRV